MYTVWDTDEDLEKIISTLEVIAADNPEEEAPWYVIDGHKSVDIVKFLCMKDEYVLQSQIKKILKMQDDLEGAMEEFLFSKGWKLSTDGWGQWEHINKHPRGTMTNEEAFYMECRDAGELE